MAKGIYGGSGQPGGFNSVRDQQQPNRFESSMTPHNELNGFSDNLNGSGRSKNKWNGTSN